MALGDYILCCKCDVKLIYDGDRGNREWWEERFGAEPAILCPNCDKREWVGMTEDEIAFIRANEREACAKVCDEHNARQNLFAEERYAAHWLASAIRARGNT